MKQTTKVSKKMGLSKGKINYRKHERKLINRFNRRAGKTQEKV
jgi:hypothetical protein